MSNPKQKTDMVSVVGVTVCVLAIVGIYYMNFKNRPVAERRAAPQEPETVMMTTEQPKNPAPQGEGSPNETDAAAQDGEVAPPAAGGLPGGISPRHVSGSEPILLARGDDARFAVDPKGNGIVSVTLPKFALNKSRDGGEAAEPVVLGSPSYPFLSLALPDGWRVDDARTLVDEARTSASVTRTSADGTLAVTERWDVSGDNEGEIVYTVYFENSGRTPWVFDNLRLDGGAMPPSVSPDRKAGRGESAGGLFLFSTGDDKVKEYTIPSLKKMKDVEAERLAAMKVKWAAVHSKYFLLAIYGKDGESFPGVEAACVQSADGLSRDLYCVRAFLPNVSLPPGEKREITVVAYAGPKNYERLHAIGNGLDSVMQMNLFFFWHPAWMGQISRWLLRLLVLISSWFPPSVGWGLAIIFLTLALKILFWPLSHKSTVSMRKMQALKPQIDQLRAQYKDNPQMLYRKQQELMRANGVSQMGGCLPLLLQIPVFFALFNTFRNAIQLRHASFLWAYDLSMPDTLSFSPDFLPIRPFALLMGVAMYLQQKFTPSADPNQARMMSLMTIVFTWMFYGMPSALTLYLTVTYLLGVLQSWVASRKTPPPAHA